jgi:GYF domain 2
MRLYFINDKEFNEGPFDVETFKSKKIHKETPIWFEELGVWVTAKEIEELEFLFEDENKNFESAA